MLTQQQASSITLAAMAGVGHPHEVPVDVKLFTGTEDESLSYIAVHVILSAEEGEVKIPIGAAIPNDENLTAGLFHLWVMGYLAGVNSFGSAMAALQMEPQAPSLH